MNNIKRDLITIFNSIVPNANNLNITYKNNVGGIIGNNETNIANAPTHIGYPNIPSARTSQLFNNNAVPPVLPNIANTTNLQVQEIFWRFMLKDPELIEDTLNQYWYLITEHTAPLAADSVLPDRLAAHKNFHLIYAYLIENTRLVQIMERVLYNFLNNEKLGVVSFETNILLTNIDRLFYNKGFVTSYIRNNFEAIRRNAYYRLFGMDLSFGEASNPNSTNFNYHKSEIANKQFVSVFERLLKELWQGYVNSFNIAGPNTTDTKAMEDLLTQLHDMLISRRTFDEPNLWQNYDGATLSREEFYSVIMMLWFYHCIRSNTSLINDFNAKATKPGERLIKLGQRVGLSAHSKSQDLIDLALPLTRFLKVIETMPSANRSAFVTGIISRTNSANYEQFLNILNLWERTTGHRIKDTVGVGQR